MKLVAVQSCDAAVAPVRTRLVGTATCYLFGQASQVIQRERSMTQSGGDTEESDLGGPAVARKVTAPCVAAYVTRHELGLWREYITVCMASTGYSLTLQSLLTAAAAVLTVSCR